MEIREDQADGAIILVPVARVDSATAKAFEVRVLAAVNSGAGKIVIDFAELDYISSAGLRVVLVGAKMTRVPRKFALCGMKPHIREIFDVSGFARILTILPDRAAALSA
ncbi:STAS domain-containing protein [Magnetospirillum gryphiswaldense]|uniref:Anti-sigma factor antagonist n=2 Tax=Magnetospirillum gryphiswaldense TaxID=55518 RepID=V6F7K2_MAGGM|nr:STAS domain-containing protein [Magnetospirillum gryphiswaldense]AVM74768.1 Putative anti-sigma factor antagonist BtrV [Magnetospirillum gryphiswaldense MSR-1]AVM78671.1 Putative anti-sigma factor antagonist BtrV [Magnetospirillum gryphiswaldense]CAM77155.1 Anti-anti-sigma regulatory factor (antagonist of anti-sigma factor) [Magnetospirillum gryphiswaldense MSR-1]CDL01332.1 putative anti-sigma factor antagonist BtrV [Magnetospirillum gryphiswaldense MSR-1 v2]